MAALRTPKGLNSLKTAADDLKRRWVQAEEGSALESSLKKELKSTKELRKGLERANADKVSDHTAYERLTGEAEARNVQTRQNFTPEERQQQGPWETRDVIDDAELINLSREYL